ncbi:MAG: hypothetical protein WBQ86_00165 [Candidatus Binatus sp.]
MLAGLFLTTLATLALEMLDTRLLSVLTWYHLSFFAISMAMFGMSAGAVHVYVGGERYQNDRVAPELVSTSVWFTLAIPAAHVLNLMIPIELDSSLIAILALLISMILVAVPFYLSGIVVALILTRLPGKIGLTYAADMVGASLGSILVIPLLHWANIASATFFVGALAGIGALCFCRFAGLRFRRSILVAVPVLLGLAILNSLTLHGFRVMFTKGEPQPASELQFEAWNTYSQITVKKPAVEQPYYWGPGSGIPPKSVTLARMYIDGGAATAMTKWNGDASQLDWVRYDVTSLPYHLRKGGDVGIIGVGGGRDVLTALWANSKAVTGIELNQIFVYLLEGPMRNFSGIVQQPQVELVNDEARSYLTRSAKRFDVLEMSLIDTFAATGAGALTLSENGLYTVEAWRVFLSALKPDGIFSVSRWFSPEQVSETSRLVALATAALIDRGVPDPADHLAMVSAGKVATLLVSQEPFTPEDLQTLSSAAKLYGFNLLIAPGRTPAIPLFAAILRSKSRAELSAATRDPSYDFSPPTDERPYFFSMLKPRALLTIGGLKRHWGVSAGGNLIATATMLVLTAIALTLVAAMILWPLWRFGVPNMRQGTFAASILYFSLIGFGFMMIQIPYMQRFSVYLGHPTYAIAVILFSMILFTGIGSWISDYAPVEARPSIIYGIALLIAVAVLVITLSTQLIIDRTIQFQIFARCLIVVAMIGPLSLLLGFCFPIGMRLVSRVSESAMPWMWGVSGAAGVLSSVLAVALSMWVGIQMSLFVAVACYAALVIPARVIWASGQRSATNTESDSTALAS